jgi:hypothetical protein
MISHIGMVVPPAFGSAGSAVRALTGSRLILTRSLSVQKSHRRLECLRFVAAFIR